MRVREALLFILIAAPLIVAPESGCTPGDHLYVWRKIPYIWVFGFGYYHEAICDRSGVEVIHLSGEPGNKDGAKIQRETLTNFAMGSTWQVARYSCAQATFALDGHCYPMEALPAEATLDLADYYLNTGGERYHVLSNNCEMAATFFKTGEISLTRQGNGNRDKNDANTLPTCWVGERAVPKHRLAHCLDSLQHGLDSIRLHGSAQPFVISVPAPKEDDPRLVVLLPMLKPFTRSNVTEYNDPGLRLLTALPTLEQVQAIAKTSYGLAFAGCMTWGLLDWRNIARAAEPSWLSLLLDRADPWKAATTLIAEAVEFATGAKPAKLTTQAVMAVAKQVALCTMVSGTATAVTGCAVVTAARAVVAIIDVYRDNGVLVARFTIQPQP